MNPAAPDNLRGGLVSEVYMQTPNGPAVPRRGTEAGDPPEIAWFNDFHSSGVNSFVSLFQQSQAKIKMPVRRVNAHLPGYPVVKVPV